MAARWSFTRKSDKARTVSEIRSNYGGSCEIEHRTEGVDAQGLKLERSPAGFRTASVATTLGPVLRGGIAAIAGATLAMLVGAAPGMAASPLCTSTSV